MKNFFNKKKKFIFGIIAVAMVVSILAIHLTENIAEVQASQTVFQIVRTDYQVQGLNVLEVTAPDQIEIGYFIPKQNGKADSIANVSLGTRYNYIANENQKWIELRRYGMVKWTGMDAHMNGVGEYPIYDSQRAMFAAQAVDTSFYDKIETTATQELVWGNYSEATNNDGNYSLNTGYQLGKGGENFDPAVTVDANDQPLTELESGYFYKVETYEIDDGNSQTLPENTNSQNSLEVDANRAMVTMTKYTKIAYTSGIPTEAITYVGDGSGNIAFAYISNTKDGNYQGYSTEIYWILKKDRETYNGNWFREYVLGNGANSATTGNINLTQQTAAGLTTANIVTVDANTGKKDYKVDLIYISGDADTFVPGGNDLSEDVVRTIYNACAVDHVAVMMDYQLYDPDNGISNAEKLAMMLWQEKPSDFSMATGTDFEDYFDKDGYIIDGEIANLLDADNCTYISELQKSIMSKQADTFAINNVYVYNHHWQDYQNSRLANEQIDALDNFANGDLASPFTNATILEGFQSVVAFISVNNQNVTTGAMTEGYVTPAIAIQYILSYRGEDLELVKNEYDVLEIQPTKEFLFNAETGSTDYSLTAADYKSNRDEFIEKVLGDEFITSGKQDLVSFTSMTIDQFNTVQEDILVKYDIVYIGDEYSKYFEYVAATTGVRNTLNADVSFVDGNVPSHQDAEMTGMIYYGYGDCVTADSKMVRYSSRDLTEAKLTDLKLYLNQNGLIIVASELMKSVQDGNVVINPTSAIGATSDKPLDRGRVDTSSNMYELLMYAKGYKFDTTALDYTMFTTDGTDTDDAQANGKVSSLICEADIDAGMVSSGTLAGLLGRERISVNMVSVPTEYTYGTDTNGAISRMTYLAADDSDGKYYLSYEFSIENSTSTLADEKYAVHLYQDVNADGRFGETEELTGYEITIASNDMEAPSVTATDGTTQYNLDRGVLYELKKEIPADEGGIVNWCLKVEKVADTGIYSSATGYTAIKPRQKKYLNILQIVPDGKNATINLETMGPESTFGTFLYSPAILDHYEVNIRTVTVSQFQADTEHFMTLDGYATSEARWQDFFNNFERTAEDQAGYSTAQIEADDGKPMTVSMLILGFGENYTQFTNDVAINAIETYIESGKPVLTSNNVVAANIAEQDPAKINPNIRLLSYIGQDRYGYTNALYRNIQDKNVFTQNSEANYATYAVSRMNQDWAVAYSPGSLRASARTIPDGYTNFYRINTRERGLSGYILDLTVYNHDLTNDTTNDGSVQYIDKMNDGQISHFPYTIADVSNVYSAHASHYQLDLDTDSDKNGDSDIIVWYTLGKKASGNSVYSATPGDGINNYYLYNYGNITYTGLGVTNTVTASEAQLFVNTLIAAYEAGLVNPMVTYYQTADPADGVLDSIAVAYDENVTGSNRIDSSIMLDAEGEEFLYKFVNPNTDTSEETLAAGTKAYFKVVDSNFVKGEKVATVAFYMGVEGNAGDTYEWKDGDRTVTSVIREIQLTDNTIVTVVRIPMDIYKADFSEKVGRTSLTDDSPELEVGTMYGIYAPMSYLEEMGAAKIYVQANTGYYGFNTMGEDVIKPLGTAYDMFTLIKQDLLKLD